jgi:hypothetical protein
MLVDSVLATTETCCTGSGENDKDDNPNPAHKAGGEWQ